MKLTAEREIGQDWKKSVHKPKIFRGPNLVILYALALASILGVFMVLSAVLN